MRFARGVRNETVASQRSGPANFCAPATSFRQMVQGGMMSSLRKNTDAGGRGGRFTLSGRLSTEEIHFRLGSRRYPSSAFCVVAFGCWFLLWSCFFFFCLFFF